MKKAIFFDIDGTLFVFGKPVPESTIKAIQELRKNGHLVFVCTGRCRVMIPEDPILKMGFDGIIGACGVYGEYEGKVIFDEEIPKELIKKTLEKLKKYHIIPIFEGNKNLYYQSSGQNEREKHRLEISVEKQVPDNLLKVEDYQENMEISKWSVIVRKEEAEAFFEDFSEDFDEQRHTEETAELLIKGESKGKGILRMCEYLGIDRKDTIGFGDSINDVEMLDTCGYSVAMGDGMQVAKDHADYVTDTLENDGIYKACKHLGLI